jgi:hypothetical protein
MSQDLLSLLILVSIVLLGSLIFTGVRLYRRNWYRIHGKVIVATVVDIEERELVYEHTSSRSYRVSARWQDPLTELSYDYESGWVRGLPRVLHPGKSKVNIFIQPDEPGKYFFEL